MKNKFITVCVILAALLSIMSFTAILMPRNAQTREPEETDTKAPSMVTFTWDTAEYTVPKGTTFGEFIESNYNSEGYYEGNGGTYYTVQEGYVCCEGSSMGIPADGVIRNGQDYGSDLLLTAYVGCVSDPGACSEIQFYNGATFRGMCESELLGENPDSLAIYGKYVSAHGEGNCLYYSDDDFSKSNAVLVDDVLRENYVYILGDQIPFEEKDS